MAGTKVQYELKSVDICKRVPFYHHLFFASINIQSIDITFLNDDVDGCALKARSDLTCWTLQRSSKTLAIIGWHIAIQYVRVSYLQVISVSNELFLVMKN